jgi:hypothetical protein
MSKYMVTEKACLKQAVPSLLAALDEIIVHPSKAEEDTGRKMLVVPLLNSSICYFSFTLSRTKHK